MKDLSSALKLLNEAGRAMYSVRDVGQLLDRILALVGEVFGVSTCAVVLLEPGGDLRIHRARGYDQAVGRSYRGRPGVGIVGWVVQRGETAWVPDVRADPRYLISGVAGAVAELAAPLKLDGEIIGVLDAELRHRADFDPAEIEIFSAFAVHAASAIHNTRMVARMERRAEDLAALNRCGRALHASLDLSAVLGRMLELAQQALHFERCAVLLRDHGSDSLTVRAARGYREEVTRGLRIRLGEGVTGTVARTGRAELIHDVAADPRYIAGSSDARAEMAVPLVLDGQVIGVLDAESGTPGAFAQYELELLAGFAGVAATAVQNARLHTRVAADARRLELLNRCSRTLSRTLDIDELLREVLTLAHEALRFERCAVLLCARDGQTLKVRAAHGYKPELVGTLTLQVGQGVTGEVARSGQPLLVPDVHADPRYIEGVSGGRCEMAAPLVARGRVIGVLDAESTEPHAFGEPDLALLATFAATAAAAVLNAELYGDLERANATMRVNLAEITRMNRELSDYSTQIALANRDLERRVHELLTLQAASRTITSSLDLDETLQAIVRMAREIIKSSSSAIKLIDVETQEFHVRAEDAREGLAPDGTDLRSLVSAPLRIGERTIGIFELGSLSADAFSEEDRRMLESLAGQAAIAIENARLFEGTQRTYFETIRSLAHALEARDPYTRGHSERVTALALRVAEAMGLPEDERRVLQHAGILHDIGKIGVADSILNKPQGLSPEDRQIIENHPLFGGTILAPLRFLEQAQVLVRHHHERYDGRGYPAGLASTAIPPGARIIAVCDAYDAMTSDRPYRQALTHAEAVAEIRDKRGTQFDPEVVEVFLRVVAGG